MKRFLWLLTLGATALLAACEKAENNERWFEVPHVEVEGTTAYVVCTTHFAESVLANSTAGFLFVPMASESSEMIDLRTPTISANNLQGTQTNLKPQTIYKVTAYVQVGNLRMQSDPYAFITGDSSENPDPEPGEIVPTFGTLVVSEITTGNATLNCAYTYTGTATNYTLYFRYKASTASSYTTLPQTTASGMKSVTLNGLSAGTSYETALCMTIGNKTYTSKSVNFTTQSEQGGGGGVNPGLTKYAGWAELPAEVSNSDYHYAYHLCDVKAPNGKFARNYGVCYSNSLKCAIWVAAPMHPFYSKKNTNRTDAYKPDPKISISQPGKWTGYTRGHMLGSAERLVSNETNKQVFYHSNIAPQSGTYFNTGGGAWNTIEDWVDTQWTQSSDTTYQVIGCYWKNKNKVVNGTTIPTHFYKILLRTKGHKNKWVVNCTRDELQCIAIMVEHRAYSKGEVAKPSEFQSRGMLHSVREIEQMTGQTFFSNVPNAPKDSYNPADWGL